MRWTIGLLLMLGGCQFIPGTAAHDIKEAHAAVRYELDDPASGNFRNDRVEGSGDTRIVCGEVNAKNRMGAYVGFRPYAYPLRSRKASILPDLDGSVGAGIALADFPRECAPS